MSFIIQVKQEIKRSQFKRGQSSPEVKLERQQQHPDSAKLKRKLLKADSEILLRPDPGVIATHIDAYTPTHQDLHTPTHQQQQPHITDTDLYPKPGKVSPGIPVSPLVPSQATVITDLKRMGLRLPPPPPTPHCSPPGAPPLAPSMPPPPPPPSAPGLSSVHKRTSNVKLKQVHWMKVNNSQVGRKRLVNNFTHSDK